MLWEHSWQVCGLVQGFRWGNRRNSSHLLRLILCQVLYYINTVAIIPITQIKKLRHKEASNYFQSHKANAGVKIRTWEIWVQSLYLSLSHATTSQDGVLREHRIALKWCTA